MSKRLAAAAAAAVLLLVFHAGLHTPVRAQGVRVYRGGQGRRVGRVTLPTPPFNPDAGILDGPKGRRTPNTEPRRTTRRDAKTVNRNPAPGTPRKRRIRRGRNARPGAPRKTAVHVH